MSEPKVKKPSLFRTVVMKIVGAWRRVMDVKYNPLKYVPDPSLQAYFMLVVFIAWSLFFGVLAVNYLGFFDYDIIVSIIVHVLVLMPLAFTNAIFVDAERDGARWLQNAYEDRRKEKLFPRKPNAVKWDIDKEA